MAGFAGRGDPSTAGAALLSFTPEPPISPVFPMNPPCRTHALYEVYISPVVSLDVLPRDPDPSSLESIPVCVYMRDEVGPVPTESLKLTA